MADELVKQYLDIEGLDKYDKTLKNYIFGNWKPGDDVPTEEPSIVLPVEHGGTGADNEADARKNIGAVSEEDVIKLIPIHAPVSDGLNEAAVNTAISNAIIDLDAVTYKQQSLSNKQKAQARANISAVSEEDVSNTVSALEVVTCRSQNLTDDQKAQARANIGAGIANFTEHYVRGLADLIAKTYTENLDAVSYKQQDKSSSEKDQALANLGLFTTYSTFEISSFGTNVIEVPCKTWPITSPNGKNIKWFSHSIVGLSINDKNVNSVAGEKVNADISNISNIQIVGSTKGNTLTLVIACTDPVANKKYEVDVNVIYRTE